MRWTAPLLLLLLTAATPSPDVGTIVKRHIDAIGGAARWRNVQSMLVQGSNNFANFVWMWKSPNRTRTDEQDPEATARTLVMSFDGTTAWTENPYSGAPKPRRLTPAERQRWETGVAIRSDLLDLPAKGTTLKLLGEEMLDGRRTYKLSVVRPGRDEVLLWIDAESYLLVQRSRNVVAPWGGVQAATTRLSDYRNVQGVVVAHRIGTTKCVVEVNPELDDDAFRPPQPLP
jgi:outer membrane lipoprotein-sorting protein